MIIENNKNRSIISWEFEKDQTRYSKYFNSCKGVFQGGGCKAIAYIGAYKRAYERGVFFSELAGTSAGSIIAALIAAGAKPKTIYDIVKNTDFNSLTKRVGKLNVLHSLYLYPIIKNIPKSIRQNLSKEAITRFGVFDSKKIEEFVENCLYNITGIHNIRFNQIVPDLNIICADLQMHGIKIWNKQNTPEESIAKAVSASCSIPIFFTPTENRYVDGGILSNLPNYIFSKEPHYNRVLCFRNSGENSKSLNSFGDYISSLIDTVVSGAIDIQQQFIHDSYNVLIKTGDISATDFDKIDESVIDDLVLSGAKAMDDFLDDEKSFVNNHQADSMPILHNEEQMYSMVSYLSLENHDEICVCCENTYWSWSLFLSIVKWIKGNTRVVVFTKNSVNRKHKIEEDSRTRMLKAMGCVLHEVESLPLYGFFFLDSGVWSGITYQTSDNLFCGTYFKNKLLNPILIELLNKLKSECGITGTSESSSVNKTNISMISINEDYILDKLKTEAIYSTADLSFENVELSQLIFMNPLIRALKYKQISLMFDIYKSWNIDKFGSAAFIFDNGKESLIGPPLVEEHNNKLYVIEGNTRCTYAYRHGYTKLRMVVARNVEKQLPCKQDDTTTIEQIIITDKKIKGAERYEDFDYTLFRHIEKALRPHDTYMI